VRASHHLLRLICNTAALLRCATIAFQTFPLNPALDFDSCKICRAADILGEMQGAEVAAICCF